MTHHYIYRYVIRHQVYGMNAFTIDNCTKTTVADVQLFGNAGMGVYASDSLDVELLNFGVRRLPGRPMSITADGTHFNQCSGSVRLIDCHIEGQGDDGINVRITCECV